MAYGVSKKKKRDGKKKSFS